MIIEYDPINGEPIGDGECEEYILNKYNIDKDHNFDDLIKISTENVTIAVRALCIRGLLDPKKIKFKFNDKIFNMNEYCVIENMQYKDYSNYIHNWTVEILKGQIKFRKENKKNK